MKTIKIISFATDLLIRLETRELQEELHDTYFQNVTMPTMKNQDIVKKFGVLSAEDQQKMIDNALNTQDLDHPTKWSQFLFGSILSQQVKLTSFLIAENQPATEVHSNYSNYFNFIALHEALKVERGSRNKSTLFLKDTDEIRAYVLTSTPGIYATGINSGQYKNFTTASMPITKEGRLVKTFAASIINKVKEAAFADMFKLITLNKDKIVLNQEKNKSSISPILMDAISLSLVDTLNKGSLSPNYGPTAKAGNSLLSSNLLSEQATGFVSLYNSHPALAEDIKTKLEFAISQKSKYDVDPDILRAATNKARSGQNIFASTVNNFASTFMNMISVIGKALGNTKVDFDIYFTSPIDVKKQQFFDAVGSIFYTASTTKSELKNAFLRLVSKPMENGYAITLDVANGWSFEEGISAGEPLIIKESTFGEIKTPFLAEDVHNHIVNKAFNDFGVATKDTYIKIFSELETKSDTQQNIGQGSMLTVKGQLLNLLHYLYNEDTKKLDIKVLFATVPSIVVLGAKYPIRVIDSDLRNVASIQLNKHLYDKQENALMIYSSLVPMETIYNKYMDILLNYNSTPEQVREIKINFINLVKNMQRGIWSYDTSKEFAIKSAIDMTSGTTLKLAPFILNSTTKESELESKPIVNFGGNK